MRDFYALGNSAIQLSGMLIYQYFGFTWAIYPSMFLLTGIILAQTIAAAYLFSTNKYPEKDTSEDDISISVGILIGIVYAASAYQILLIGFPVFAGLCFAHAGILILTKIMKVFAK